MFVNKYEKMNMGSVDEEMFQLNKVNQELWDQQKETKDIFGEIKSRNSPYKTQKNVNDSISPKQLESKLDSDLINSKQKEIQLKLTFERLQETNSKQPSMRYLIESI